MPNSVLVPQSGAMDDRGLFIIYSRWVERDGITGPDRSGQDRLDYELIPGHNMPGMLPS